MSSDAELIKTMDKIPISVSIYHLSQMSIQRPFAVMSTTINGILHLELQQYVLIALQLKEYRNKKSTRTKTYK
jgi:hypothetical protein